MIKLLRILAWAMGIACTLIGIMHFVLGIGSVPGELHASATVDSRERFYGAIFMGYGVAWLWTARQATMSRDLILALSGIFFLGGVGRLLSIATEGYPHWFQSVLTIIELALSPLLIWLATRVPAQRDTRPGASTVQRSA